MNEELTQEQNDVLNQNIEEVIQDTEQASEGEHTVRTSTGALLRVSSPPDRLIQALWRKYPEPRVPMIERKDGTKTTLEPNPDDPAYLQAREERVWLVNDGIERITFLKGVEIVELPEGVPPFDKDDGWADEYEDLLGYPPPEKRTARYMEWLNYRIVPNSADMNLITEVIRELSGVDEEDIEAAEESFRGTRRRRSS